MNPDRCEKNWNLMDCFFEEREIELIDQRLRAMKVKHIVYCSFESRFAKSGGLGAVTAKITPYLGQLKGIESASLITPFYPGIIKHKLSSTGLSFTIDFAETEVPVEILEYRPGPVDNKSRGISEYYLSAPGYFDAIDNNPYLYQKGDSGQNDDIIRKNALFFCKAVPLALKALGLVRDVVLHLQEWQTALLALTIKEAMLKSDIIYSCGTVQTLHNPFDSSITTEMLKAVCSSRSIDHLNKRLNENPERRKNDFGENPSAYRIGLQLTDGPITTVSETFAEELTTDVMQTAHFAPHLQDIFKKSGVFGINNGLFVEFPPEFPKRANLTPTEIREIKKNKRRSLLNILSRYTPKEQFGSLSWEGQSILNLPDHVPIFVMSGRLDPGQKGFDILLRTLERFEPDRIKTILTPLPSRKSDLDYFYEVACKCKGDVTVFPVRMDKGYLELQMGATFGIMPSIYEPFGAAVEYMVNGTAVIARSTGGLKDQIKNGDSGLLYREETGNYTLLYIRDFAASGEIVQIRKKNPWAQDMADALYRVMVQAAEMFRNHPETYYRMISNGFKKAAFFDWKTAAEKYFQIYSQIPSV